MTDLDTATDLSVEERRGYLGGTDAAAILGVSPWRTAFDVFADKRPDVIEPRSKGESWAMTRGKILEDPLAGIYEQRTGRKTRRVNQLVRHKKHGFIAGHIDRKVQGDASRIVEIKTSGYGTGWGTEGTDEIPQHYLAQVQHYMLATGAQVCDVIVDLRHACKLYEVKRNDRLLALLEDREVHFWASHVEKGVPPQPSTLDDCKTAFAHAVEDSVATATDADYAQAIRAAHIKEQIASLESDLEEIEVVLKCQLGVCEVLLYEGSPIATWKETKPTKRLNTKALKSECPDIYERFAVESTTRRFLLKAKKEG